MTIAVVTLIILIFWIIIAGIACKKYLPFFEDFSQCFSRYSERNFIKSEILFRSMFEDHSAVMFLVNPDNGKMVYVNRAAEKFYGYTLNQFQQMTIYDINQLSKKEVEQIMSDAKTKNQNSFLFKHKLASNQIRDMEVYSSPILFKGEIILFVIAHDVTERKKTEHALLSEVAERKRAEKAFQLSEKRYKSLVENQTEIVSRFLQDGRFSFVNDAYCKFFNKPKCELIGRKWHPLAVDNDLSLVEKKLKTLSPLNPSVIIENRIIDGKGSIHWMQFVNRAIFDNNNNLLEIQSVGRDITDLKNAEEKIKNSLKEKEVLVREIHHRVKNNLMAVSSLIEMQAEETKDSQCLTLLRDLKNRVMAMTMVHQDLYQSENLAQIEFSEYLKRLVSGICQGFSILSVNTCVIAENIFLEVEKAVPCGLIVTELVTNSFKYAFPQLPTQDYYLPEIRVEMTKHGLDYILIVSDNGEGFQPDFNWRKSGTLGLELVQSWAEHQLRGKIYLDTKNGTFFKIIFAG